ncbi:phage terminase large subunit [Candidatus Dependentiae bacterium]|nr:phage terminase large subunit [Candidatus Dependentiae bacterium]
MQELHPVKASEWIKFTEEDKALLKQCGAVPVNDIFFPFWNSRARIKLLYGGYGSGKSVDIADNLINQALNDKYFKCYYGRKIFDTVRGSCFETLYERIEDHGLQQYFSYSPAPTSTMIIQCVNGNKFIPFGSDKPDKLKSIKDPTHIWCEEFDQFEDGDGEKQGDFQLLFPRLRTTKAITQFIGSFNTAPVMPNHWVLKYFFPELYVGEKAKIDILDGIDIQKIFANYSDNYFINQEEYYKQLVLASGGDTKLLDAIAKGDWGAASEGLLFPLNELKFYEPSAIATAKAEYLYIPVDPADKGGDFYAALKCLLIGNKVYITEVIFNNDGTDVNIPATVDMATGNKADFVEVEGNSGWVIAGKDIRKDINERMPECEVRIIKPYTAKETRILAMSSWVKHNVYFNPEYRGNKQYTAFINNVTNYRKEGKNPHDDGPDVLAQLGAFFKSTFSHLW